MGGIDPLNVEAGDVVVRVWDEDPGKDSCHCAFRVEVKKGGGAAPRPDAALEVGVMAHSLKPGDVIRVRLSRGDEGGCHCDVYFAIDRVC